MSKKPTARNKKSTKKVSNKKAINKKVKNPVVNNNNATKFKIWCIKEGITQVQIQNDTKLSIGCIHSTWNEGKATDSTIKLISLVYNLDEAKLKNMMTTFEYNNSDLNNNVTDKKVVLKK
jgi:hypothetical protein